MIFRFDGFQIEVEGEEADDVLTWILEHKVKVLDEDPPDPPSKSTPAPEPQIVYVPVPYFVYVPDGRPLWNPWQPYRITCGSTTGTITAPTVTVTPDTKPVWATAVNFGNGNDAAVVSMWGAPRPEVLEMIERSAREYADVWRTMAEK